VQLVPPLLELPRVLISMSLSYAEHACRQMVAVDKKVAAECTTAWQQAFFSAIVLYEAIAKLLSGNGQHIRSAALKTLHRPSHMLAFL